MKFERFGIRTLELSIELTWCSWTGHKGWLRSRDEMLRGQVWMTCTARYFGATTTWRTCGFTTETWFITTGNNGTCIWFSEGRFYRGSSSADWGVGICAVGEKRDAELVQWEGWGIRVCRTYGKNLLKGFVLRFTGMLTGTWPGIQLCTHSTAAAVVAYSNLWQKMVQRTLNLLVPDTSLKVSKILWYWFWDALSLMRTIELGWNSSEKAREM
jgi:hypothetical protein